MEVLSLHPIHAPSAPAALASTILTLPTAHALHVAHALYDAHAPTPAAVGAVPMVLGSSRGASLEHWQW